MNIVSSNKNSREGRNGKHKPVRWFSMLLGIAVLAVSGTVLADVVLSYALTSNIGASGSSPFTWNEGTNYPTASTLNIVAATSCSAGLPGLPNSASTCYSLTTSVNGVASVTTLALNVYEFDYITAGDAWTLSNLGMTFAAATQGATPVGCAFAVISDGAVSIAGAANPPTPASYYQPTLSETGGGEGAGGTCTAAVTTVGAGPVRNSACDTGTTVGYAIVDLLKGTSSGPGFSCTILKTTPVGTTLTVSYMVYAVTGATATGAAIDLNSVVS